MSAWIQRSTSRSFARFAMYASAIAPRQPAGFFASASSENSRKLPPRLVEAREVEVALRAEVPVEDRLGDPGLAGDLGRRRAAVALLEEDAAGRVEHDLPAVFGREPRPAVTTGPSRLRAHAVMPPTMTAEPPAAPVPERAPDAESCAA